MNNRMELGLLVLRLGLGAFLLLFGIDKLVAPYTTVEVFARYYDFTDMPPSAAYIAGVLEIALAVAILAGIRQTWSYGLGLLVHAVSTLATYEELLSPFGDNHLYLAAIPVLAGFVSLFLLRRYDVLWRLGPRARSRPA
ncbi:membrane protein [Sulfurifustis variabilis]|uniref:Methylamine utilization protein MauE n=1 Tax=Sulfurifustis variabilis TaxID=1675686 RepID=A0A1B4V6W2_9GAMM|nr:DoxX family membrane protein [Sulfurifustis variabilis]BAU49258.1 membrane protein [Sulfurifustis variabilis]